MFIRVVTNLKSPNNEQVLDKTLLKFFSDVMYLKEIICIEEYHDIMDCCDGDDLDNVFENMMLDLYKDYGRGEMQWEMRSGEVMNY